MSMHTLTRPHAQSPSPARSSDKPATTHFLAISTVGRKLVQQAAMVSPHLSLAFIEGEAGVGKQSLARLLHSQSAFARFPFHRCDAREWLLGEIDPDYLTGFTYLDRVDLLAAPGQALLLRVLKSLENRVPESLALVASAQSPLRDLTTSVCILPDLAFRLSAVRFRVPPLRERREDIVPLATLFLERLSERYRRPHFCLAPGAAARLLQHQWPGNARELSSVLECAVLEADKGFIHAEDLPIVDEPLPAQRLNAAAPQPLNLDTVIQTHVRLVLNLNRGNKLKTARHLGISRSTLYRLLEGSTDGTAESDALDAGPPPCLNSTRCHIP